MFYTAKMFKPATLPNYAVFLVGSHYQKEFKIRVLTRVQHFCDDSKISAALQ